MTLDLFCQLKPFNCEIYALSKIQINNQLCLGSGYTILYITAVIKFGQLQTQMSMYHGLK